MTKEEERNALQKIMKIINSLPEDSYVRVAAEGLEEIAKNNIESDFLESWKARCLYHMTTGDTKAKNLQTKIDAKDAQIELLQMYDRDNKAQLERLDRQLEELQADREEVKIEWSEMLTQRNAALDDIKALQAEIMALKAKLYDMMISAA